MFVNPPPEQIAKLLRNAHLIAVVGLSPQPARPSHEVARALQGFGYRVIPVTPAVPAVLGEVAVPALAQLPQVLGAGERVDIVDVFRRPVHVAGLVDECIRLKLPALWLQKGVIDEVAAARAVQAGIFMVMDRCLYQERAALR
jgi:predicted CoA-binding protein